MFVIGLDIGDHSSHSSYIAPARGESGRLGGRPVDLMPSENKPGIPSAPSVPSIFFYSKTAADRCLRRGTVPPPWCGLDAKGGRATPAKNRIRGLKRHMGEPLTLDDWAGTYDDALVALIQYVVRLANQRLLQEAQETSCQVALAYPVSFSRDQRRHLKELAERATLEDGTPIEVVGMIAEPAAAALDYLADSGQTAADTTVLTFDLGGSTLDLAVVSAHPQGILGAQGTPRFYDILSYSGDPSVCGAQFDAVMKRLMKRQIPVGSKIQEDELNRLAEEAKLELSQGMDASQIVTDDSGEEVELVLLRTDFEKEARPLMDAAVQAARRFLASYIGPAPELIVLSGGPSNMPMVRQCLEEAFPQFQGKVVLAHPSSGVSYGAARFGVDEAHVVHQLSRDIGVMNYDETLRKPCITNLISAGTQLPCASDDELSANSDPSARQTTITIYEALVEQPDIYQVSRDYRELLSVVLHHAPGARFYDRVRIDENGLLRLEAEEASNRWNKAEASCQLSLQD